MADIEVVVVGAGVVGLAIAQRLARAGREVLVVEQEAWAGQHASSRNSEVIHAGLYYPPGSLKAQSCAAGRDLLYAWCETHGVPHRRIGKLLVAVEDGEVPTLAALQRNAQANGIELQWLDRAQLHAREPSIRGVAGLFSPLTGIVDSHALLQSFEAVLQQAGGMLQYRTRVEALQPISDGLRLRGYSADQPFALDCRYLVNAGGLFAQQLLTDMPGLDSAIIPPLHLCRGQYFSYSGRSPFQHLVYPMPEANTAGLGVHATLDLAGQLRFGPDVRYTTELDYAVCEDDRENFARAIRRYWPDCESQRLVPAYAGIRAKLTGEGEVAADFIIQDHNCHTIGGLINLFGIESPGLTASLALAEEVARRIDSLYP
ncbi:MAG: NAD(P)/FAD-dependent oxidoreductase [Pseudomonas sp.]